MATNKLGEIDKVCAEKNGVFGLHPNGGWARCRMESAARPDYDFIPSSADGGSLQSLSAVSSSTGRGLKTLTFKVSVTILAIEVWVKT